MQSSNNTQSRHSGFMAYVNFSRNNEGNECIKEKQRERPRYPNDDSAYISGEKSMFQRNVMQESIMGQSAHGKPDKSTKGEEHNRMLKLKKPWWNYLGLWSKSNLEAKQYKSKDGIQKRHYTFTREDQTYFCTSWTPSDNPPKALLFVSHHYRGQMNRETVYVGFGPFYLPFLELRRPGYDEFAHYFCKHGIVVFGHDHFAHGRTAGKFQELE